MRDSINEYNDMMNKYTKRTTFNSFYFQVIIRYKIDRIMNAQINCHHDNDFYETMEDELWMLSYYEVGLYPFRNMDFSMGYRTILLT